MASDEDDYPREVNLSSVFGSLISKLDKMSKNPEINMELNETLNTFMDTLNESQQYLENGIVNVKFAEAGLFLQNAANVYSKQVDHLWNSTLKYQMQLCTYNKAAEENAEETAKITQRLNRNKRKKIVINNESSDLTMFNDLNATCNKAAEFLEKQSNLIHTLLSQNDDGIANNSDNQSLNLSNENCISGFSLPIDFPIRNCQTGEKLCNYNDLHLNCTIPYLDTNKEQSNEFQLINHKNDILLQKYLNLKRISYNKFWDLELGAEFELFKHAIETGNLNDDNIDHALSENSNVITIASDGSQQLLVELDESAVQNSQTQLTQNEKQDVAGSLKKGSERISNADSLFHDEPFDGADDSDDNGESSRCLTQQSRADSGICCCLSDIPNSSSVLENHEHLEQQLESGVCSSTNEPSQSNQESNTLNDIDKENVNLNNFVNATENSLEIQSASSNQVPSITDRCNAGLSSLENSKSNRAKLKRKKFDDYLTEEDFKQEKRRRKLHNTYKWLKTYSVLLTVFERFYRRHYRPDFGEGSSEDAALSNASDDGCEDQDNHVEDDIEATEMLNLSEKVDNLENISVSVSKRTDNEDISVHENNEEVLDASPNSHVNNDDLVEGNDLLDEEIEDEIVEDVSGRNPSKSRHLESERVKVVSDWKRFIEPKLKHAEESSKFDIHEYGTLIMDTLPSDTYMHFKEIAAGKPSTEVTRLFLATLQLANTNNVELSVPSRDQSGLANDTLQLKLLTRERYHERLDEFEAPSENLFRSNLARLQASRSTPMHSTPKSHKRQRVR